MGTTVATNALLERQGAKTVLFITKGFKVRKIGRHVQF
jgi:5-oxoprolinase (ATP-hydrolysing)